MPWFFNANKLNVSCIYTTRTFDILTMINFLNYWYGILKNMFERAGPVVDEHTTYDMWSSKDPFTSKPLERRKKPHDENAW